MPKGEDFWKIILELLVIVKSRIFCFILDCYGFFTELWQFSSFLVNKGLQVLEVGNATKF